jgi:GTPase SAR1 family protein
MSTANKGAHSSSDLPVRQGVLSAEEIRADCPQFRILIIGKANAGKTTILRKVCNAKRTRSRLYMMQKERKSKERKARKGSPNQGSAWESRSLDKTNQNPGHHDSLGFSRCLRSFDETSLRDVLQMS